MNIDDNLQERRREPRKAIHLPVLIKIESNLYGKGVITEISQNGARIESIGIFNMIRPSRTMEMKGMTIYIHANAPSSISLQGIVMHASPHKNEAGISITNSTDRELWQRLAEANVEG